MENVIDIRTALEQLGTGWQFGGSVTDGTQAAWDSVVWEDTRGKPTWADLCAVHEGTTLQNKLAAIEATYSIKFTALDTSLLAVLWADGANEVASRQALSAKRQQLIADKTAAIANVFLNG